MHIKIFRKISHPELEKSLYQPFQERSWPNNILTHKENFESILIILEKSLKRYVRKWLVLDLGNYRYNFLEISKAKFINQCILSGTGGTRAVSINRFKAYILFYLRIMEKEEEFQHNIRTICCRSEFRSFRQHMYFKYLVNLAYQYSFERFFRKIRT